MSAIVRHGRWLWRARNKGSWPNQLLAFSISTAAEREKNPSPPPRGGPPPIRVEITQAAGRGVFATRRIDAGELIHTAKPIVAHPSFSAIDSVCYFCLKKLTSTQFQCHGAAFCSQECKDKAKVFYDVEKKANWSAFNDYCRTQGLKFPLLVKRLACMVISAAAPAESLDILQPAGLSREMVLQMEEGFNLLRSGLAEANMTFEQMAFLTKSWYIGVLSRIHINAFRVELAVGFHEDLLSAAAACAEAEVAVGNGIYMLPSFYNHDCDPNAHIIWIDNADARLKALRDVEADEELRICYIDASLDHDARQTILLQGFGFKCSCSRCLSGD